jgi:hypothetical protein
VGTSGHTQVIADLVDHDQGRVVADELLPDLSARCGALLVALADDLVACLPADLVGDLAPERVGAEAAVVHPVGDLHVRADDPGDLLDRPVGQQFRRDEARHGLGIEPAPAQVAQRDQVVGLAAAEARLQADDRGAGGHRPAEPAQGLPQQGLEPPGGIGVGEEGRRILIDFIGLVP